MKRSEALEFINDHGCSMEEVAAFANLSVSSLSSMLWGRQIDQESADDEFEGWARQQPVLTWYMVAHRQKCGRDTASRMLAAFRKKSRSTQYNQQGEVK